MPDTSTGHVLRRATALETTEIIEILTTVAGDNFRLTRPHWESGPMDPTTFVSKRLPETEWRYFVIAFQGLNDRTAELDHAFLLATTGLEIGFRRNVRGDRQLGLGCAGIS